MSIRNRAIAAVGGVGLTLAIAVGAVAAGGSHGGTIAPTTGGASPSAAASTTTGMATSTAFSFGDLGGFMGTGGLGAATIAGRRIRRGYDISAKGKCVPPRLRAGN